MEQEAPIELRLRATKEGTVYETFISQEFKELLQLYLPTIKGKWLFQGIRKDSHAKDETLNTALKNLAKRAGIQLHGRLHWHCGRKLVMRTGAELGISPWIVKKMIGKSIPKSDDTYLSDTDLRNGFLKLSGVLKLKPNTVNGRLSDIDEVVKICGEALAEMLKPTLEKLLLERQLAKGQSGTLGLLTKPDLSALSTREILELYLKLKRGEE